MLVAGTDAFALLDVDLACRIIGWDEHMDDLHRRLLVAVFGLHLPTPEAAVELGLVGRFYERLADHAVVVAERVRFVAVGSMNSVDIDESDCSI